MGQEIPRKSNGDLKPQPLLAGEPTARSVLQSLENGLDVLALFAATGRSTIDVPYVMRSLGLARSTAYRLMRTLQEKRFLQKGARTGAYAPGPAMRGLGERDTIAHIARAARPFLANIAQRSGIRAFLSVRDGFFTQSIAVAHAPADTGRTVQRGARINLHAGATGQVFMAYMPRQEVAAYLSRPCPSYTTRTVTDAEALRQLIVRVRAEGHAVSVDHAGFGSVAVSVPVWSAEGRIAAGLTLAAAAGNSGPDRLLAQVPLMRRCAAELTERL